MIKQRGKRTFLKAFLLVIGILLILTGVLGFLSTNSKRAYFGVYDEEFLIQVPIDELPSDTFYITETRKYYQRGKMTLIIPSVEIYTQVGESTLPEGLKEMPGLYEFSQLPGEGDVNVSIAGHRDIHDKVFYDLHKLEENDYAYLLYEGIVYRYLYKDTRIVEPTEWSVIKPQGFSCLTLTTCDPIGTTLKRMIARWELVDYEDYSEQYLFVAKAEGV